MLGKSITKQPMTQNQDITKIHLFISLVSTKVNIKSTTLFSEKSILSAHTEVAWTVLLGYCLFQSLIPVLLPSKLSSCLEPVLDF